MQLKNSVYFFLQTLFKYVTQQLSNPLATQKCGKWIFFIFLKNVVNDQYVAVTAFRRKQFELNLANLRKRKLKDFFWM